MFVKKKNILVLFFLFIMSEFFAQAFETTWQTTSGESITIPANGTSNLYTVDWGDGTIDVNTTGNATHTYSSTAVRTILITGNFRRILFNNTGDKDKILSVEQWGAINWSSMQNAFRGCTNLQINASDTPDLSGVGSMQRMFDAATAIGTGTSTSWNSWVTSTITNMSQLFRNTSFNKDISSWDTS